MTRWIRLHQSALHNPKLTTLTDRQHRAWNNCLLMAAAADGALPPVMHIASHLRMSIPDAELILSELVEVDLIDMSVIAGVRSFKMHDWKEHQYLTDVSTDRVRKFRNKNKDGTDETFLKRRETVSETAPESEPDTDTDTNTKLQLSDREDAGKPELGFRFDLKSGLGSGKGMATLMHNAEGFGLDVDDLLETTKRNKPKKPEGYFATLCVNRLKGQLPGLDEQIIRDALNGRHEQLKTVCALLVGVAP